MDVRRKLVGFAVKTPPVEALLERQPLLIAAMAGGLLLLWMAGKATSAVASAASDAAGATVDAAAGVLTGGSVM